MTYFGLNYTVNQFSLLVIRFTHYLNWNCKSCSHRLKPWLIVAALFHHLLHMVAQYFSLPKKEELASEWVLTTVHWILRQLPICGPCHELMSSSPACEGQLTSPNLIYMMGIIRSPWQQVIQRRLHSEAAMGHLNGTSCHLDFVMPQAISNGTWICCLGLIMSIFV